MRRQPPEPLTPYTLWSRDRLLGHSDLDYICATSDCRMGDFHPTELGESLMPVITGVSRAIHEQIHARMKARASEDGGTDVATELADTAAAETHFDSLELELRGPDGVSIPTESIGMNDCDALVRLSQESDFDFDDGDIDPDLAAEIERDAALLEDMFEKNAAETRAEGYDVPQVWEERPFPQYQLIVTLAAPASMPSCEELRLGARGRL